jgi:hypothetical protein
MGSRKLRITSLLVLVIGAFGFTGLLAPGAFGQTYTLDFIADPADTIKSQIITSGPLNPDGAPVQVMVTSDGVPQGGVEVTLVFAEGSATTGTLDGNVATTESEGENMGVATFDALTIGETNEPTLTDYQFEATVPVITIGAALAADPPLSEPFDVWDAGCKGTGNGCTIGFRGGLDSYKSSGSVVLTASTLSSGNLPNLDCPGQKLIFGDDIFSHATSGSGAVAVTSTITKTDFRNAGTNFGQAHVEWCVGIQPDHTSALHNGGVYVQKDTNDDGTLDLFVGFAPKCPKKKVVAPCIVSQTSDGKGGSITKGFLEGGDPPRRT